jgi:hypothetical protein
MLKKARNNYIEDKYLPENVTLEQYYHLRQDDVNAMLKHWTERQAAGEVPFRFKKEVAALVAAARKNNRTPEENDADSDSGLDVGTNSPNERALPGQGLGNAADNPSNVGWSLKHSDSRR